MRRLAAIAALVASILSSTLAQADVISERPDTATVTIYRQNATPTSELIHRERDSDTGSLALIAETRTIDLPAGESVIRFRGVASTIVPETADVEGLPSSAIERNFDYDLLSPGSLIAKSVGKTVHLIRTNRKTGATTETAAIIRSGPNGIFLDMGGRLEALGCSGLPEKLVLDGVPADLTPTPTLSVRVRAPAAERFTLKVSYLATNLDWSADYVARIDPGRETLTLSGMITLANFSETSFPNAPTEVVAGTLETTGNDIAVSPNPPQVFPACWPVDINWAKLRQILRQVSNVPITGFTAPAPGAMVESVVVTAEKRREIEATALGDYKLYRLPEATDVLARQTKQVAFIDRDNVSFERIYEFRIDPYEARDDSDADDKPASIVLRMQNREDAGLGKPLPSGIVSVVEPGDDGDVMAGQGEIGDVSIGLPVEITTGRTINVRVQERVTAAEKIGSGSSERTRETRDLAIINDKATPVHFELYFPLTEVEGKVVSESQSHVMKKGMAMWDFTLAPGQHLDFTCEVERSG